MDLDLTNTTHITQLLKSHGLHTQKQFGQHFLTNKFVLTSIITTADILPTDTIVEIGPGIGVLTVELAKRGHQVISFEIDKTLKPVLAETLKKYPNVELVFEDIIKNVNEPIRQIAAGIPTPWHSGIPYKLVSNLPYNVGSHILDLFLKSPNPPQSITVLLQKEVAQKIVAVPPHATYLSNFFQLYGQAQVIQTVPPKDFFPPPKVDSAILQVKNHQIIDLKQPTSSINPTNFSRFLHHGFAQPRKKINKAFSLQQLQTANIDPNLRPENLTFDQWLMLFNIFSK